VSPNKCAHSGEGGRLEVALLRVKNAGLKLTSARKQIIAFLTSSHGPFTIEEIHEGLAVSDCNLVTVYRTLASLEESGLVRKYEIGDRVARFEYLCDEHPHHHLICSNCKKIEVLEADLLSGIKRLAAKKGFRRLNASVDLFGLCDDCQ
jgi:Fur family transcriptional regulator, ferric uptake regulator